MSRLARWSSTLLLLVATPALAQSTIGSWIGSGRTWNDGGFGTIRAAVTGRGHTVAPDAPITAANLAGYDVFMLTELTSTPTAGELADLSTWLTGGGRLIVMFESFDVTAFGNATLAGVGSAMSAVGGVGGEVNGPALPGNFATEGGPFNLVGQSIDLSLGFAIGGGTPLIGNFLAFQQIGSGFVYAFGDRVDQDFSNPTATDTNGQLFINIIEGDAITPVPEPGTVALVATGLLTLVGVRLRRRA